MKSVIQEASTLSKAIEQGWIKAGKPSLFSIKIMQDAAKNFIGMTTQNAKIVVYFGRMDEIASSQPQQQQRPKPQLRDVQQQQQKPKPQQAQRSQQEQKQPRDAQQRQQQKPEQQRNQRKYYRHYHHRPRQQQQQTQNDAQNTQQTGTKPPS